MKKQFVAAATVVTILIFSNALKSQAAIADGFEYENNHLFKQRWQNATWSPPGGFSLSSRNNHTLKGSKSIEIDTNGNRQLFSQLCKSGKSGNAFFWFYDPIDSITNSKGACVGLKNFQNKFYWRIGVRGGNDDQLFYCFSDRGSWHKTKIRRKKGWHKFEFNIGKTPCHKKTSQVSLLIDGVEVWNHVYKNNTPQTFNRAFIQTVKGSKDLPFYVDDFCTDINTKMPITKQTSSNTSPKTMKNYKFTSFADPQKWFTFPIPLDGFDPKKSLINFSFLLDAPAGKHGFVKVKDGHFVFEDGTPARFFGLNIHSAKGLHLSHKESEVLAERLASFGCNLVRLHSIERPAPLGILDPQADDTVTFDAKRLDMLDYFIYALKKRGIYVKIDIVGQCHRRVKINDGLTGIKDYGAKMYKGIWPGPWGQCYFDPKAESLAKRFSEKLLNHVNPYTKLRLAEEPAIAFAELSNEANVARMGMVWGGRCYSPVYQSLIQTSWNRWLLKKYKNRDALAKAWTDFTGRCALGINEDPKRNTVIHGWPKPVKTWRRPNMGEKAIPRMSDFALFLEESIAGYTIRMQEFLKKEIKVKYPILDTNDHGYFRFTLRQAGKHNDFSDVHAYWSHPPKYYNFPAVKVDPVGLPPKVASLMIPTMGRYKIAGLPLLISEWNTCWPDEWRSSDMLLMAAYSCLNDWDGPIAYSYMGGYAVSLKETPRDRIKYPTMFNADPAEMGIFPLAALAFHRRYISVSKNVFEYACSDADTTFSDTLLPWIKISSEKDPMLYLPLIARTQTKFFDKNYVPSPGVTMTINGGITADGDYSKATHAMVIAGSPFRDSRAQKVNAIYSTQKLWPNISGWLKKPNQTSVDWGINSRLPNGCQGFYTDSQGRPAAIRDSRFAAVPNSEKLSKHQLADFVMDAARAWGILKKDRGYCSRKRTVISDTGEIKRNFQKGQFIVDTKQMMAFSGFRDDGKAISFKQGKLELKSPYATIALISIDGKPLSSSNKMLLMAQGRCDNAGSRYEKKARKSQAVLFQKNNTINSIEEWNGKEWLDIYDDKTIKMEARKSTKKGTGSVIVEPVQAVLNILREKSTASLEAILLDRFGQPQSNISMQKTESGYTLQISPEWETIYCLISAK